MPTYWTKTQTKKKYGQLFVKKKIIIMIRLSENDLVECLYYYFIKKLFPMRIIIYNLLLALGNESKTKEIFLQICMFLV